MKIALASDHAGFEYKEHCKRLLLDLGHAVEDVGTDSRVSVDYPDFAFKAAALVAGSACSRAILFCGSGIGMCMAANRVPAVRAAVGNDEYAVQVSRMHNDANILCVGARIVPKDKLEGLIKLWLDTPFEGGRHSKRVEKLSRVDDRSRSS